MNKAPIFKFFPEWLGMILIIPHIVLCFSFYRILNPRTQGFEMPIVLVASFFISSILVMIEDHYLWKLKKNSIDRIPEKPTIEQIASTGLKKTKQIFTEIGPEKNYDSKVSDEYSVGSRSIKEKPKLRWKNIKVALLFFLVIWILQFFYLNRHFLSVLAN